MHATFLVLTIISSNGIETWHERTSVAALCHGHALLLAQKAAARGSSVRYSCKRSIVVAGLRHRAGAQAGPLRSAKRGSE